MEKIIKKFKEVFDNYDYANHNITKLVSAVELLMQMMSLVDAKDQEYIKKISSFLNLVSSDIDSELLDIGMVEYIYVTKVVPILEYFEYKYKDATVRSSLEIIKELLLDQYTFEAGINRKEDKRMFGKLKDVGMNLEKIYRDVANQCKGKERSERALRDLKKTSKTMSLLAWHDNVRILDISNILGGISQMLEEYITKDKIFSDDLITMSFERMKNMEFT